MLHFQKNTGNVLALSKQWPKFFKCRPINILSVMLAVEVTKFFSKDTCICDVIQCIHDETWWVISKICADSEDLGIFNLLVKHFYWPVGASRRLDGVVNLRDVCCYGGTICMERASTISQAVWIPKTWFLICWTGLTWSGMSLSSTVWRAWPMLMKESCRSFGILHKSWWCLCFASIAMGFPMPGGTSPELTGFCHVSGSESAYISGLMNIPSHSKMVNWVDGIMLRRVLIISSNLSRL